MAAERIYPRTYLWYHLLVSWTHVCLTKNLYWHLNKKHALYQILNVANCNSYCNCYCLYQLINFLLLLYSTYLCLMPINTHYTPIIMLLLLRGERDVSPWWSDRS